MALESASEVLLTWSDKITVATSIHFLCPKPALKTVCHYFMLFEGFLFEMNTEVAYMCISVMQTADFRDFLSVLNLDRGATHRAEKKQWSSSS